MRSSTSIVAMAGSLTGIVLHHADQPAHAGDDIPVYRFSRRAEDEIR